MIYLEELSRDEFILHLFEGIRLDEIETLRIIRGEMLYGI